MSKFAVRAGRNHDLVRVPFKNEPVVGTRYSIFLPGEPVPKSTQAPPKGKGKAAQYAIVMNPKYKNFAPLRRTWTYQAAVRDMTAVAIATGGYPIFHKDDPVSIGIRIQKEKHARGDLKNHEAGIEDAFKMAGVYPDDAQIRGRLFSEILYYCEEPGVYVEICIHESVYDDAWLSDHLKRNKKAIREYKELRRL